jgi:MOSC domain-containing protein YiiM
MMADAAVLAVSKSSQHEFSKTPCASIFLAEGLGVENDCHAGVTVQHLSRVKVDPTQPNLRQVHLIHGELLEELSLDGYHIAAGDLGENITTRGIDLLALPKGCVLKIGDHAIVEITGLRNPCQQIEAHKTGLLSKVLVKAGDGTLIRKTGVMGVVRASGHVRPDDRVQIELPPLPHVALEKV